MNSLLAEMGLLNLNHEKMDMEKELDAFICDMYEFAPPLKKLKVERDVSVVVAGAWPMVWSTISRVDPVAAVELEEGEVEEWTEGSVVIHIVQEEEEEEDTWWAQVEGWDKEEDKEEEEQEEEEEDKEEEEDIDNLIRELYADNNLNDANLHDVDEFDQEFEQEEPEDDE